MQRIKAHLVVVGVALLLVACGGSTATSTDATTDAAEETTTTAVRSSSSAAPDDAAAMTDDADAASDDDGGETSSVSAIDDIPQVCRDLMADFLQDIEPIVSPIEWTNATFTDFETINAEFEPIADQFEADSDAAGDCDDIDLESDESFNLLIEFAQDEAPGTVGFLEFISDLASAAVDAVTGADGASFNTCEDAIAFIDNLMAEYDSLEEVPVTQLTAIAQIATVIFTCTPEQAEYFDSPEVSAFLESFFG